MATFIMKGVSIINDYSPVFLVGLSCFTLKGNTDYRFSLLRATAGPNSIQPHRMNGFQRREFHRYSRETDFLSKSLYIQSNRTVQYKDDGTIHPNNESFSKFKR
jgi:hypothetical protein